VAETLEQLRAENIQLRREAHYYKSLHAKAVAKLERAAAIITALKQKVAELVRRRFGRSSEKNKSGQNSTSSTSPGATTDAASKPRGQQPGSKGHGRRKRPDLPEKKLLVDFPAGTAPSCDQCNRPYRRNGTVGSYVEIVYEVEVWRRFVVCQQYEQACSCPQPGLPQRISAPPPPRLIERGILSVESIVQGLLSKFRDCLPNQRLIRDWSDLGGEISPGTWCGVFQQVAPLFEPLMGALLEACRADRRWLMDETRWAVWVRMENKGSYRWWLWVVVSPRVKLYILSPSRGQGVPKEFFGYDPESGQCAWTGPLMVDRFSSYKFLSVLLTLAFCWTHVRRDFVEAQAGADAEQVAWAQQWIERIGRLYGLNARRLELGRDLNKPALPAPFVQMDPKRMAGADYQQSQQALVKAVAEFEADRKLELAQNTLPIRQRKILTSLQEHWSGLTLFVDNPEIPMDNNGSEQAIRIGAVARKNFYGSGAVWSGELLTSMLTITQTAMRHGVNVRQYLIDYLQACAQNGRQAPKEIELWLPWNYRRPQKDHGP
jgi:transposase